MCPSIYFAYRRHVNVKSRVIDWKELSVEVVGLLLDFLEDCSDGLREVCLLEWVELFIVELVEPSCLLEYLQEPD